MENNKENISPIIQPQLPKRLNKKLVAILALVVLFGLISISVFYSQKDTQKQIKSEDVIYGQTAGDVSTRKIYRDETNGFEFQYPKNWIVEIIGNKTLKNSLLIGPADVDDRTFIMQALSLDISDSSKYSSLKNFAEQQAGREDGYVEKIILENTQINNIPAIKIHSADKSDFTRIVFFYREKAFLLYDSGSLENESNEFKNILSTFKFIP